LEAIEINFYQNPALFIARFIKERGFEPLNTLIISPTQRFKSYLSRYILKEYKAEALIAPFFITSSQLRTSLTALTGCQIANKMECFTMLYESAGSVKGMEVILGEKAMETFSFFRASAEMVLKLFDELNTEEVNLDQMWRVLEKVNTYGKFKHDLEVLKNLYNTYYSVQERKKTYDEGFLLKRVEKEHIRAFFKSYNQVILALPLSLTDYEKRVYSQIKDKLYIIYQNTPDYDFSKIQGFRELDPSLKKDYNNHLSEKNRLFSSDQIHIQKTPFPSPDKGKKLYTTSASTRMEQVMMVLSIIREEIDSGLNPEELAVINVDSQFSEMLYHSLLSLGYEVNFSEGLRVIKSPLYQLLHLIYRFFNSGYDSELFLAVMKNEFISEITGLEINFIEIAHLKEEVYKRRLFKLPSLDIDLVSSEHRIKEAFKLFECLYMAKTPEQLYGVLKELFSNLKKKRPYEFYAVKDIILNTVLELGDLSVQVKESPLEILLQVLKPKRYPLKGVYTRGIQIIGILETRGITFKTVIVPSLNEGFFPSAGNYSIIFNTESRNALGLPTLFEMEDLQFYYLKRLVDSSEKSYLLHIQDKRGEIDIKSRFHYLLGEVEEYHPSLVLPGVYKDRAKEAITAPVESRSFPEMGSGKSESAGNTHSEQKNSQTKTFYLSYEDIFQGKTIPEKTLPILSTPQYEFSRLDLDRLKKCQTMYYIARILKVEDEKVLLKEIEREVVGLVVHEILNRLYRDYDYEIDSENFNAETEYNQKALEPERKYSSFLKGSIKERYNLVKKSISLKERLHTLIDGYFKKGLFYTKEEELVKKIVRHNLEQVIERDVERFQKGFRVCREYMEKEFKVKIGENENYTLRGRIDRIDRTPEGRFLIIDYKTGSIPVRLNHFAEKGFSEVQLGFYGLLFKNANAGAQIDSLCYYDLTGNSDLITVVDNKKIDTYLQDFEAYLLEYLVELNQKSELSLTLDYKNCDYCNYHSICRVYEK